MTETQLIALLLFLTVYRVIAHLKPDLVLWGSFDFRLRFRETIDSIIWAGVAALFLIHFVVRSFYIPSESMLPTLQVDDYILVNKLVYRISDPVRGEVAVFHPNTPTYQGDKTDLIKRVVALEGDTVEIRNGVLYLNDLPLEEPYLQEAMDTDHPRERIEPGHIFVLGDNRNDSQDSRVIGQIPMENLVGRADIIFWPFQRLGPIRAGEPRPLERP